MLYTIKSKIISLVNRYHFYALIVLFLLLTTINYIYCLLFIFLIIYLIKNHLFTKGMVVLSLAMCLLFTLSYKRTTSINRDNDNLFSVVDINYKKEYKTIIAKINNEYVIIYDYNNSDIIPGDLIKVRGKYSEINNFNDFDYKTYMKSKKTYLSIQSENIIKIRHNNNLDYYKYELLQKFSNYSFELQIYIDSLIFGKNISDELLKDNINKLGIGYLFVISGFHISLLSFFIKKVLNLFIKDDKKCEMIIIPLLIIYGYIASFQIGILRAIIMYILARINRYKNLSLTKLDIFSITFILMLIINPLYIFRVSFKYSFISTLFIILGSSLIKSDNKIVKAYFISLLCYFSVLPITININNQLNLLSLFISPIYVFLFSYIIMPLIYLLVIVPQLSFIISDLFVGFNNSISELASINNLIFKFKTLSPILIIIYYLLFFIVLISIESKRNILKKSLIFSSYLIIIYSVKYFNPFTIVSMINVGQGDSFLIQDRGKNMAIDSYNSNIDYIKALGIEKLDILLITHSDNDHINSATKLVRDIKVDTLILNKYEDSVIIDDIRPYVKNVLYLSKGDVFYFNSHICNVLGPENNIDKNNNSLVFDINLNNRSFLFTGDMEEKEENEIFDEYLQYDFLKVPHHGSDSSMKDNFLKYVRFKYALISVGINNKYNHPSVETINKLDLDKTYMTSKSNSVRIYLTKYNYYIYESIRKRLILNVLDMI